MNKPKNLYDLMQNIVVGSIALHSFTLGYYMLSKNKNNKIPYPRIEFLFYVLPIVYNRSTMETFLSSNELYSAILKNTSVILGLQERANKQSKKTFDSLNLAFSKNFLYYNKANKTIHLGKGFTSKKLPLPLSMNAKDNSVKKMQDSSYKLGSIFAKREIKTIEFELNIKIL